MLVCPSCDKATRVAVGRRFGTVVTSSAGYPLDKTYYQTVKGMVTPLDILAQQLVATAAAAAENEEAWSEDDLYALVRRDIPHDYRLIKAAGSQQRAIAIKGHAGNIPGVPSQKRTSKGELN